MDQENLSLASTFQYSSFKPKTESEICAYLTNLLSSQYLNDHVFNIIDYELIIYYEFIFKDNINVMHLITLLKEKIAINWLKKQQLMSRLQ